MSREGPWAEDQDWHLVPSWWNLPVEGVWRKRMLVDSMYVNYEVNGKTAGFVLIWQFGDRYGPPTGGYWPVFKWSGKIIDEPYGELEQAIEWVEQAWSEWMAAEGRQHTENGDQRFNVH